MIKTTLACVLCLGLGAVPGAKAEEAGPLGPSHVELRTTDSGYQLYRNGEPYFVQGAGAKSHLKMLKDAGANSIRTWNADHIKGLLDEAHGLGMTVTVGLWMGHERHGFNYADAAEVQRQLDKARRHVQMYKNHPALLMWGIGNEVEWIEGTNRLIYKAVNEMARMVKAEDPHHPTAAILAELGVYNVKLNYLREHCPDIDILGVNTFGGCRDLADRLEQAGWKKPYLVTEFGPLGPWETGRTTWGAEHEQDSTTKGKFYFESYMKGIHQHRDRCLGSYAFFWGQKHETTPTWFSMLLHDGTRFAPVDYMTAAWSKKWPSNRCPDIEPIQSRAASEVIRAGGEFEAEVLAHDPDSDPLEFRWEIYSETRKRQKDGGVKTILRLVHNPFTSVEGNKVTFRAPQEGGYFRLFVYVSDGHGNGAYANMPFQAK